MDETSVLADLDFMLDSEMNLDKLVTPSRPTRPNPKDYRRRSNKAHISRSSSDLNRANRPVNISRSSSNVERRGEEPISPLGRIPEADYPRLLPRAQSANHLYSSPEQVFILFFCFLNTQHSKAQPHKTKPKIWTKVAYRNAYWTLIAFFLVESSDQKATTKDRMEHHLNRIWITS